jgi:hypothetical protein
MNAICDKCPDPKYPWQHKTWRIPCADCADHHKEYHEEAFPGHTVNLVSERESGSWMDHRETFKTSRRNGW